MARLLRQSTAYTFRVGPLLDSTDGVTAETALTIAQADLQISKDGAAFAQTSASPTTTHDADGWYQCPLTATDTNTLGPLTVQIVMAGALPVWEHFMVVPGWYYDLYVDGLGIEAGTAQAGAAGTVTLASTASATDDIYNGMTVHVIGGTGVEQARVVTDYNGTTKVATIDPNWATNPDNTSVYVLLPSAPAPTTSIPAVNATQISGDATAADNLESMLDGTGGQVLSLRRLVIANTTNGETALDVSATGTGNSHAINAASTNGQGFAVASTNSYGMSINGSGANDFNIGGTNLSAADIAQLVADWVDAGRLDALVDAIKAKTDSLTFTVANVVDANVQRVNDVAITGDGQVGTEFSVV